MLTSNARKLLKYCAEHPTLMFSTDKIDLNFTTKEFEYACHELADHCCIKILSQTIDGNIQFELVYKGQKYKEIRHIELLEFLHKSILIPLIVALLTSAITTYIGWKWGHQEAYNVQIISTPSNAPTIEDVI